jgi:predicted MFS family arabinose efflux permease
VTGALLVTAGLTSLTYGIVRTDTLGWGSLGVLGPLAAALILIAAFLLVEGRGAEAPLVPLSIFRLSRLRAANLVVILMYAAMFSSFFFITLYLQQVLRDDALQAGLAFLPMTLAVFTGSSLAPRLVARFGVRFVVTTGMVFAAAGLMLFTGVHPGGSYFTLVLPGAMLSGLGMGLGLVSSTIAATQGVPAEQSGLASGLLNLSRLFGGALGLAILSTLAASETHASVSLGSAQALTNGFGLAFQVGALFCVAGALLAVFQLRPAPKPGVLETRGEDELEESEPLAA